MIGYLKYIFRIKISYLVLVILFIFVYIDNFIIFSCSILIFLNSEVRNKRGFGMKVMFYIKIEG